MPRTWYFFNDTNDGLGCNLLNYFKIKKSLMSLNVFLCLPMFTNVDNWNSENIYQWKMIVGSVKISEHQKSHFTKERKKNFRRMNLMFYRGSKIEWPGSNFQPWSLDQNYFDLFETFETFETFDFMFFVFVLALC